MIVIDNGMLVCFVVFNIKIKIVYMLIVVFFVGFYNVCVGWFFEDKF